ncbi:cytidyltransferase [Flavobacterium album]|uniref:Cytidyltransferase n=1 Tax=Flavobacterium album TaxID=2175091 RepID=A0A2S1QX13_9FLAO|nr:AAA family ATPase [Flavobacterium album]AWH84957.1 cytidyltransferase [Flavobacterium album]
MVKAFVFGKFLPFHKGHEAMIRFALTKSDFVSVLVCCSDKEDIPAEARKRWISATFSEINTIEVLSFEYKESDFPNTSASSKEVSAIWAPVFSNLFPDHSLLITSEPYGDYVAEFMGIRHIPFDIPKQLYPVSATLIRNNVFEWWDYLPDSVKPYYAFKITILGTESAGKTTLAQRLSAHFGCILVNEAGRDIIPNSNSFTMADLHKTAIEHARRINEAEKGNCPLIIIDTDVHITRSYAQFTFGEELHVSDTVCEANKAGLCIYLTNNSGYFQDGSRLNEAQVRLLDLSHRKTLDDNKIPYIEIGGSFDEKFEKAVQLIKNLIRY